MLIPLIVFVVVATLFVIAALLTSWLLRPHAPTDEKLASYECGAEPFMQAWRQINVHYYIFAIMFVLFDVEAAFLFPIALVFHAVKWYAFFEVVVFIVLLLVGWLYASRVGGLEWER